MKEIKAYIRPHVVDAVVDALEARDDRPGVTISEVQGFGHARGGGPARRTRRAKLEIVVANEDVEEVVDMILRHARSGAYGDGKIFVTEVTDAIRIRTHERGATALRPSRQPRPESGGEV